MSRFSIRKAKPLDVPVFVLHFTELMKQHLAYDPRWQQLKKNAVNLYRRYIRKQIKNPRVAIFVAEQRGKIIGHITCKVGKRPPVYVIDKTGYVGEVFVDMQFRKQGVGTSLMIKADQWFKRKKLKAAILQVHVKNKRALKTYEKCGFEYERFQMRKFIRKS